MTHMKEYEHDYSKLCEMKKTLCCWVEQQIAQGPERINAQELGEAVDMIKDFAEAEKACYEACYYKAVVEAMEEYEENPRMGYNPNRNRKGQYSDVRHPITSEDRMGYDGQPYEHMMRDVDRDAHDVYGKEFSRYRQAKRHYTETHSEAEHQKMKEHANHHIMEAVTTLKEIWSEADPDLRQKMKNDLGKLMGELN